MGAISGHTMIKWMSLPLLAATLSLAPLTSTANTVKPAAPATVLSVKDEKLLSTTSLIDRWAPFIKEASRRFGVAEDWIRAVMRMESGGRTLSDDKKPITSRAGAMGLMQVMPDTYSDMRQQYGLGANPHDPRDNILAGTAYLSWLHEKYGYPKMFAAYNAGPGTLEAQLAGTRKLPGETRDYVRGIAEILGIETVAPPPTPSEPEKVVATLTRPTGTPITIDADSVTSIRASFPGEFVPGVRTVVMMGERQQGVTEDLEAVSAALKIAPATPRLLANSGAQS